MSDLSSLSSLSGNDSPPDDDDVVIIRRTVRERLNPFNMYNEAEFKIRFRFSKEVVMELLNVFGREIEPSTLRNKSICARDQLLLTLRFYSTAAFQQLIGDTINVNKSTVSRIVCRVTRNIAQMKNIYVKMPVTDEERTSVKLGFFSISGFPGVIGAVDCTHIKILSPGGNNAELFRNRKGYFSINVQVVCNAHLKIQNVIARWPGSVHDSTIFNDSALNADMEYGTFGNHYLLGDNGYPCKNYLLTPFINPRTASERAYNAAQIATRNPVERCFGLLKRRFPCLSMGMRISMDRILATIVACTVLHNLALELNDDVPDGDYNMEVPVEGIDPVPVENILINVNTSARSALVATTFDR